MLNIDEETKHIFEVLRDLETASSDLSASLTIGRKVTPKEKEKADITIEKVNVLIELVENLSKDISEKFDITFGKLDEIRDIQDEDLMHICESLNKPLWEKIKDRFEFAQIIFFIKNVLFKVLGLTGSTE